MKMMYLYVVVSQNYQNQDTLIKIRYTILSLTPENTEAKSK